MQPHMSGMLYTYIQDMHSFSTYFNMDIMKEVTFHSLCCIKSTRKVSREIKYFIDDSLEELSECGYFDTSDSQCEVMMTNRCIGTFKSMYQWVYGRKFK